MERLIRRFLTTWLLLLGGVLLTQHFGYSQLAYWLFVPVAIALPLVIVALLGHLALRLRGIWWRIRVLWRASKWKRWRQRPTDDSWLHGEWDR